MRYTRTTDDCPTSCSIPCDVPSGVGFVISATYCIPMGATQMRKNPKAKDIAYRSQLSLMKVRPMRAGMASTSPKTM